MTAENPGLGNASAQNSARRTWLSLCIGALVSGIAVWLIARDVNLNQTLNALSTSNLFWFLIAFLTQNGALLPGMRRWQILLLPSRTRFLKLLQIYFVAHVLNTVLPAKLGTVVRVLLAAEQENLNVGLVLGSVALEKVLDTLLMFVALLVLAPFVPLPDWVRESLAASVILFLIVVLALVSAARLREPLLNALTRIETRVVGHDSARVALFARGLVESLLNLTKRREAARVLFWTLGVWLLGIAVNYFLFRAVNLELPWSAALFLVVVLQIGTRVPALPANIGVFHYLVILALGVYGVNESAALAYAILLHLIVFILPAFIGAACALPMSARLTALVAARLPRGV